jgi:hypothetical protein
MKPEQTGVYNVEEERYCRCLQGRLQHGQKVAAGGRGIGTSSSLTRSEELVMQGTWGL